MKWEDMERMEGGEGRQDSWERGVTWMVGRGC